MNTLFASILSLTFLLPTLLAAKDGFTLDQLQAEVELYDNIELEIKSSLDFKNPFTDVTILGCFTDSNGRTDTIEGFCDDPGGKYFRIRYMPRVTGSFKYRVLIRTAGRNLEFKGDFLALFSGRKGPLQVDSSYPWHMIYEGTGEHFFWNATTAYWMMGWKDDKIIHDAIDRLAFLGVNRIRVAINGRSEGGIRWYEPLVKESAEFTFLLNPWMAASPASLDNPDFDVTRFNVPYWQKLDRLVRHARDADIIVSLIFYVDGRDHGCDPFKEENMGNEDEQRYYRYAVARYAGFPNIMWDVTNEYHLFRSEEWVNKMGRLIKSKDPGKHLVSVHGHAEFPFRLSPWVDVVLYQSWDECGGYQFMTDCRNRQAAAGRILPQVNEEYGYEDHYPPWGCGNGMTREPDGRSAENRRQLAWEIYMAGGYQTTGERANEGTGAGNDKGGGWINGRGNDKMIMLKGYAIIRGVFELTSYWKLSPHSELVNYGNLCLASPGEEYIVYSRLSCCRVILTAGTAFSVTMVNPRTGEVTPLMNTKPEDNAWEYPKNLAGDWVFVLKKMQGEN
jgi:hypothetical protein